MSTLVQAGGDRFLFDCGRGAIQRLTQIEVPPSTVDKVFLTHMHSDHLVGLPDLWLTAWILGRKTPLRVWGPKGTQNMMHHLEQAFQPDIILRRDLDELLPQSGIDFVVEEVQEDYVYEENGVKITTFDVDHYPVVPAYGFRVDYDGRSVVLSGDTRRCENLVKYAQRTHLLIHEVIAPEAFKARTTGWFSRERQRKVIDHHTTPEQAGEIFSQVQPKLAVYSHIIPTRWEGMMKELTEDTRKTCSGAFEVGHDLMAFEIGDEVRVVSKGQE